MTFVYLFSSSECIKGKDFGVNYKQYFSSTLILKILSGYTIPHLWTQAWSVGGACWLSEADKRRTEAAVFVPVQP